jgi:hypothetical protein
MTVGFRDSIGERDAMNSAAVCLAERKFAQAKPYFRIMSFCDSSDFC